MLITMARALLRRSSIIVLDEATSSIDFPTDSKIQATICQEVTDPLLLTGKITVWRRCADDAQLYPRKMRILQILLRSASDRLTTH